MGKFVRRNKLAVIAASLVIASLTGGIVSTTFQARRAERRFQLVRQLANTMLFELQGQAERLPGSTELRASTVRTVVKYLDTLAQDGSPDPDLDLEIAAAYEHAGGMEGHPYRSNLGRGAAALSHYRKAIVIYERLANRNEVHPQAIRGLIDTHLNAAQMEAVLGNPGAAASHFQKASAIAGDVFARGSPEMPRSTQLHLYSRLADAQYQRGAADAELAYYGKALEICQQWVAVDHGADATSSLRDAYQQVGSALARSGNLRGARDSYQSALKAAEELVRQADTRQEQHYNVISLHNAFGDLLAAPDDPNFGDRAGALSHYQTALSIAEGLAAADPKNVNARRNVATCYRRLGMIRVDDNPAQALDYYRKALPIAEELNASDPPNIEYRYALSRTYMGLGEALHRLRQNDDAIQNLTRAVDYQKSIAAVSPQRIWHLRVLSRTYRVMSSALLDRGDSTGPLDALQEGLAVADQMLQQAPSSLYHQLDRADLLEAMGRYYLTLAARPGIGQARRAELKAEARSCLEKELAIWRDWKERKAAVPYAARRESQAATYMALCNQP